MSASVYFLSCSKCASTGLSTVCFTSDVDQDRYQPFASRSAIVNSSRNASRPLTVSPDGSVTVTLAGLPCPPRPPPRDSTCAGAARAL